MFLRDLDVGAGHPRPDAEQAGREVSEPVEAVEIPLVLRGRGRGGGTDEGRLEFDIQSPDAVGLGGAQKLLDAKGGLSGEDEHVRGQWTDLDGKALVGQGRHDAAQDLVARRGVGAIGEDDANRRGAVWRRKRRRRPRRLREGEGEVVKVTVLKSVAHEVEGLVGIGGEEKHAPDRVLSRGMWDEGDVLLLVDDSSDSAFSDSDLVGDRHRRPTPEVIVQSDARDARAHA